MLLWTIIIPTFSFLNVIFFLGLMSVVGIIGHLESCDNFFANLHSYFLCQNLRTQNPACVKKLQISGTSFKKLQWKVGVRGRVYWINRLCINFTQIKYLLRNNNTTRWIFVGHGTYVFKAEAKTMLNNEHWKPKNFTRYLWFVDLLWDIYI